MGLSDEDFECLKQTSLNISRATNASYGGHVDDYDIEMIIMACCEKLRPLISFITNERMVIHSNQEFQIPNRIFSINLNARNSIDTQLDLNVALLERQRGDKRLVVHKIDAGLGLNMIGEHMVSISYVII